MTWEIQYIDKALKDLEKLDNSQRLLVLKAVQKVQINPLPDYEGGYGKPLGNHSQSKLAGLLKIKLKKNGTKSNISGEKRKWDYEDNSYFHS